MLHSFIYNLALIKLKTINVLCNVNQMLMQLHIPPLLALPPSKQRHTDLIVMVKKTAHTDFLSYLMLSVNKRAIGKY